MLCKRDNSSIVVRERSSSHSSLVAVIDSGWDTRIFDSRVVRGLGFVDPDAEFAVAVSNDFHDINGHGSMCSRLVWEHAPDARILPLRVFGSSLECSAEMICTALLFAADHGATVANLSLATIEARDIHALYRACEYARSAGTIVVAAAAFGVEESYPASFDNVLGVTAGQLGSRADYAFFPDNAVELVARGDAPILDAHSSRRSRSNSYATARMSGIVSSLLQAHGRMDIYDLRRLLESKAPLLVRRRT